nr:glycoprotein integral membrane protein 1 [Solea senegalensis]
MAELFVCVLLVVGSVTCTSLSPLNTESLVINVTAGTVADTELQQSNNLQINLNISVSEEQVMVNEVPVELSEVTRFNCPALLLDSINGSSEFESGDLVSTVTRVMVSQNRLYSSSDQVLALQVFSEVIEMEGSLCCLFLNDAVQQPDMCEVKILMSPDFQKLAQFINVYPIGHSEIFRVPRENDVVVTNPPNPRRNEDQLISQTTSQYPLKHTDTTQEETAAPGKLPETPLRMDPDLLHDVRYREFDERDQSQSDRIQMGTPPTELMSSYSAMCQWMEQLRERLRRFCSESLPLFFLVMWVVVIGVAGSAVIVKILDMFFPTCEHKHMFHMNPVTVMADDEKHTLLESIETQAEEEDKSRDP